MTMISVFVKELMFKDKELWSDEKDNDKDV